ncbi:uncharacterized protein IUM83_11100 [Phytophthora cinnamomi]|uniref:uncharacterized protein n=1 Tax=Phytophthora cinnamomi TaxID=4785 RepID=UPI0035597103|nr:hypothetical protein IUM83_11100 [Phytophthora cinnamomi]
MIHTVHDHTLFKLNAQRKPPSLAVSPHTCLTLEQKLQVHLKLKQNPGMNNPMLAEWIYATFKAQVSRATLARLRNLPSSYFSHVDLSATKRRRVKFPQFERELREFFFQNEAKTAMADDVLLLKAHELAERLGIDSTQLRFSNGWLQSFKKRNGIRSHVLHGEGGAVEDDAVRDARLELQELAAEFAPDDVLNFDETALFYRLAPNRTISNDYPQGQEKGKATFDFGLLLQRHWFRQARPNCHWYGQKPEVL